MITFSSSLQNNDLIIFIGPAVQKVMASHPEFEILQEKIQNPDFAFTSLKQSNFISDCGTSQLSTCCVFEIGLNQPKFLSLDHGIH